MTVFTTVIGLGPMASGQPNIIPLGMAGSLPSGRGGGSGGNPNANFLAAVATFRVAGGAGWPWQAGVTFGLHGTTEQTAVSVAITDPLNGV